MALNRSTGYLTAILGPHSFEDIFNGGCIEIRTGSQPATADDAPTGTLIARVTRDGLAWTPGDPAGGLRYSQMGRFVSKRQDHAWALKGVADGMAGWFRILPNQADPGSHSETARRIDGAVGLSSGDGDIQMRLPVVGINSATEIPITQWWWESPLTYGA